MTWERDCLLMAGQIETTANAVLATARTHGEDSRLLAVVAQLRATSDLVEELRFHEGDEG